MLKSVLSSCTGRSEGAGPVENRGMDRRAYRIGIDQALSATGRPFLIATPEKALADKVHDERGTALLSLCEMKAWLMERLGIAPVRPEPELKIVRKRMKQVRNG